MQGLWQANATAGAYKLRRSTCAGVNVAETGVTANTSAQLANQKKRLEEEWARSPPGEHKLQWDGHPRGMVGCNTCTQKWRYPDRHRHKFMPNCHGSCELQQQQRQSVQKEIEEYDGPHSLKL